MTDTTDHLAEKVLDHMTVFHGSTVPGIKVLDCAEEDTVGAGLYATTETPARGYAHHRARHGGHPTLYQLEIAHARLVDLTDTNTAATIVGGFGPVLQTEYEREAAGRAWPPWLDALRNMLGEIDNGHGLRPGMTKLVTRQSGELFTTYLQELGFDGVYTREGGEGQIGAHETYLIFDPTTITITNETALSLTDPGVTAATLTLTNTTNAHATPADTHPNTTTDHLAAATALDIT